jgi:7-cyano-7-deazaguanine synthase
MPLDAIVLVSGGLDSCVTAAIAARENSKLGALHVSYGQRTAARERRAFEDICGALGISERLVAEIGYLTRIGGSSLTDPHLPVPDAELRSSEVPTTYVPFRNTHLLAIAASWAEVEAARRVYIGAVEEDYSGYPDCRRVYFDAFEELARLGSQMKRLEVVTPLTRMRKREIVLKGVEIRAPLELTWSCYRNEEVACGRCDSCALRLRGFREAGVEDPIPYEERPTYS